MRARPCSRETGHHSRPLGPGSNWPTPSSPSAGEIRRRSRSERLAPSSSSSGAARHAAAARILIQELDLKPHGPIGPTARLGRLTPREIEVLRLVAQGLSDREAAARLKLSEHTVHRHIGNILTKTGLPSRAAAVAQAARNGLL
ncbi:MAG: helix-turn-helix transcriptional regulator [Gemmatimonadales bacterium]|nr:helix-turn-helix transcriptional regulator [Gemmatimonadales bacterium]